MKNLVIYHLAQIFFTHSEIYSGIYIEIYSGIFLTSIIISSSSSSVKLTPRWLITYLSSLLDTNPLMSLSNTAKNTCRSFVEHYEKHASIFCRILRDTFVDLLSNTTRKMCQSFVRTLRETLVDLLSSKSVSADSVLNTAKHQIFTFSSFLRLKNYIWSNSWLIKLLK